MQNQFRLERLAKKGVNIFIKVADLQEWQKIVKTDPTIPRSFPQLRRLARTIFAKSQRPRRPFRMDHPIRGITERLFEECGESLYSRFFTALCNPSLTKQQRAELEAIIDADTPTFENSKETDHFILKWTNSSTHAADNIADPSIIDETAGYLETAWERYNTVFGKAPYCPPGSTKIEVVFLDLFGYYGIASPPDGPIQFDAYSWVNQPGIRQPVSAHELFHKLQYAFGFRTRWRPTPTNPYKWFSEGTASWAEVFVWQRVCITENLTELFSKPDLNLYDASYSALPFWIFFQTRQQDAPDDNPLISFFQKYEASGDEKESLAEVIDEDWPANNVYGQLDNFFALFSRERRTGAWRQTPTCGRPYTTILDPSGNNIVPTLAVTEVSLGSGDEYVNTTGSVSKLGSDYYRFNFEDDTGGQTFTVSVIGVQGGDYSYYLVWEKNGAWKKAAFPPHITGNYSFSETIDLGTADSLMLIISGRGKGGAYTITASVS